MAEIAALVALALNDKGIPHEIASLVALARNDKGIPRGIAALVALARNDKGIPQGSAALVASLAMTTPARHCEAIYCRSNPIHGTRKVAIPFS